MEQVQLQYSKAQGNLHAMELKVRQMDDLHTKELRRAKEAVIALEEELTRVRRDAASLEAALDEASGVSASKSWQVQ